MSINLIDQREISKCDRGGNYQVSGDNYRMVGNFHEIYFRIFFVSQELFTKTKTANFLLSICKANEPHFNLSYLELSI